MNLQYHNVKKMLENPNDKKRLSEILKLLKQKDVVYKEDIQDLLNISERSARRYITALKYATPIISFSGKKGYRLAKSEEDYEKLKNTTYEYLSRTREFLYIARNNLKHMKKMGVEINIEKDIINFLDALNKTRKEQFNFNEVHNETD